MRDDRRGLAAEAARTARLSCLLGMLLIAGCGTSPPKPAKVNGTIQAAASLNPSVSARPSPLRMRVYELKSAAAFNQADFMSLYQSDQAALGADLTGREEFILQPGEARPWVKTLGSKEAKVTPEGPGLVTITRSSTTTMPISRANATPSTLALRLMWR